MDDSDYTSAESSDISDDVVEEEDEREDSDNESPIQDQIHAGKQPVTDLQIKTTTKNKKKNRKISIKNAFRRGRHATRALEHLRKLIEEAIQSNLLQTTDLWGIPLLPSKGEKSTDLILLKFLRSRDWKVPEAYEMLIRTVNWRRRERIDGILNERLEIGEIAGRMVVCDRNDRDGRPICYSFYGELSDGGFYGDVFGKEERREGFVRWRIQALERVIRDGFRFRVGGDGVVSLIEVSDLKGLCSGGMKSLVPMGKKMLGVLQEYYPDIVYRNIIINPPTWFHTLQGFLNQHCSAGTRKKFVVERSNRITSRLLKYIEPQNIPIKYGGLKRDNDEFSLDEVNVNAIVIKGGQQGKIEIPINEVHVTIVWDVMVVGSEVLYKEEFVPYDEGSYKVLVHKESRIKATIRNSFYINEPGKILITIKNSNLRRKRVFWRYKCKATLPAYVNS